MHLELGGHPGAAARLAPARRLHAVDLLDPARGALLGGQLEPRHGLLAVLARGRVGGGVDGRVLGRGHLAQLPVGRVEVEERGRRGEEVVVPADHVVARGEALVGLRGHEVVGVGARLGGAEVEGEGDAREHVEQVRVGGRDARGVEEGGHGADGGGDGGRVGEVAGVVLRAAADGYVLEGEAFCHVG